MRDLKLQEQESNSMDEAYQNLKVGNIKLKMQILQMQGQMLQADYNNLEQELKSLEPKNEPSLKAV